MTRPTREELLSYFRKYGVERVDSITRRMQVMTYFQLKLSYLSHKKRQ